MIYNQHNIIDLDIEKFAQVVNRILGGTEYYKRIDGSIINKEGRDEPITASRRQ